MRRAGGGIATAAVLLLLALALSGLAVDRDTALAEGNRRFEREDVSGALEIYAAGWRGDGTREDALLAYNAGTSAQRLGRLPEALLWYRRAERVLPGDSWLQDNLALTRHALGDPPIRSLAGGSFLVQRRSLAVLGVALAWAGLFLFLLARRPSKGLFAGLTALALLACLAFLAGTSPRLPGPSLPRAAVLLASCPSEKGLPAGSEVWVRALDGGGWRIVGERGEPSCPPDGVALIGP